MTEFGATLPVQGFDVGILVADLDRSTRFYAEVLDFVVSGDVDLPGVTMRGLSVAGSTLKLVALTEQVSATNPPGLAIGLRYLTVYVPDIAAVTARCVAAGAELLRPIGDFTVAGESVPRAVTAIVADPDGNRIELCQGSPWKPDAR